LFNYLWLCFDLTEGKGFPAAHPANLTLSIQQKDKRRKSIHDTDLLARFGKEIKHVHDGVVTFSWVGLAGPLGE
jgi:hypothetical protein